MCVGFVLCATIYHVIYVMGQLNACESSLTINPISENMMMYCEYEDGDVWIKSMKDIKTRISMTTGELQVSN